MKKLKPTHKVSFWGVRCFLAADDPDGTLWGCNWFWDLLIHPVVWFHWIMTSVCELFIPEWEDPGFRLVILECYTNETGNNIVD